MAGQDSGLFVFNSEKLTLLIEKDFVSHDSMLVNLCGEWGSLIYRRTRVLLLK